jgi:hypothetical protein
MNRKYRIGLCAALLLAAVRTVMGADVAFVYSTEEDIRSGKSVIGTIAADGIVAPADTVLAAGGEVFVGVPGDAVKKASLIRMDKDLNLALLRAGKRVLNPELQAAHRRRSAQLQTFLPMQNIVVSSEPLVGSDFGDPLVSSGTPAFQVKLNGSPITKNVMHFKPWLKKVRFSVELICIDTEPVRTFSFRMHSNPRMVFVSRESSLARELAPGYDYEYKSSSPVKPGKTMKFPLEARGIGAKDSEWIVEIRADGRLQQEKLFVHFD